MDIQPSESETYETRSPFDKLLEDDTVTILENLIPFCDSNTGKALALYVKCREISTILSDFNDEAKLHACGFQPPPNDIESLLQYLKNNVSPKKATEINQLLQMLQFAKMYQSYSQFMKDQKESPKASTPPNLQNMMQNASSMPDLQAMAGDPAILSKLQAMAQNPAFLQMMNEFLNPQD